MTLSLSGFKMPQLTIKSIELDDKRDEETIPLTATNISASSTFSIPQKCTHNGWKPETMQAPVLLSFAIASLLIAALLEVLAQKAASEGGALSIVDTADDIPPIVTVGYLYLPTIVAVIYSLAWNWIDLDVKRMQPWLELSRPGGAPGKMSLFLDYPVDFVAFVPFKAARRRHWAVFYSGTVMVVIFWVLTPMQGAVFGTGPVLTKREVEMRYPLALVDSEKQAEMLDQAVLNAGYAVTWLGQTYPPFTTDEYALLPFEPPKFKDAAPANWTGRTTKYWTELDCWPAEITPVERFGPGTADFGDGKGCNASQIAAHPGIQQKTPYKMYYIGYQESAWADYSLQSPTCGKKAWNEFLATWSVFKNDSGTVDMSAIFCETAYFKQDVTATVKAADKRPIKNTIVAIGDSEKLKDAEFNTSAFQYLIGSGASSVDVPREYPFTHLLEHYFQVSDFGLSYPLSPMIGFTLGNQNFTIEQYSNATHMSQAFRAAHKMLFSVAFQHLLATNTSSSHQDQGDAHFPKYGIIISRLLSALVEGFLALVAMMTLLLFWVCQQSPSRLSTDPSSLGSLVKTVQNSSRVLDLFSSKGHLSDEELCARLGERQFELSCGCQSSDGRSTLNIAQPAQAIQLISRVSEDNFAQAGYFAPMKSFALRRTTGFAFLLVLGGALGTLAYLWQQEKLLGGLIRPSTNLEVNQLLTNYIPTAFATLVEPLWVLLNRLLCILQPFYDLNKAQRSAKSTMDVRYTALPPQLAFIRAVKSKHFLLAAICVTALLGNVLAVGLGAIFDGSPKIAIYPEHFRSPYQPSLDSKGLDRFYHTIVPLVASYYEDPYYAVMANLSYGTSLIPWTTERFSFLPIDIMSTATLSSEDETFTAETMGYGVAPGCTSLGRHTTENKPPEVAIPHIDTRNSSSHCSGKYSPQSLLLNSTMYSMPEGPAAAEIVDTLSNDPYTTSKCDEVLVVGISRSDIKNRTGIMDTSLISCIPVVKIAKFHIRFNRRGEIKSASPLTGFNSTWPYQNATLDRPPVIAELNHIFQKRSLPWHNTTISYEWFTYLLKLYTKNDALLDPSTPTPNPEDLLPAVEDLYQMLFAAFISLNPYIFATAADATEVAGTRTAIETRIVMPTFAFSISTVIIAFYMLMVILYYIMGVKFFLPRMPSTVGSLLAYIAPSSIIHDDIHTQNGAPRMLLFGRFVGQDGRAQVGIEYADRTIPLHVPRPLSTELRTTDSKLRRLWARRNYDGNWL